MLIVEKGRGDDKSNGSIVRNKTLDQLTFLVFEAKHTKILHSDNQKQTAEIIKRLASSDAKKAKALPEGKTKVRI